MADQEVNMANRSTDPPVKVTREISLPWLLTGAAGLIVQAVIVVQSLNTQVQSLKDLTAEVRELRTGMTQSSLKIVEHDVKLADHERRLQTLEQLRGRP